MTLHNCNSQKLNIQQINASMNSQNNIQLFIIEPHTFNNNNGNPIKLWSSRWHLSEHAH